MDKFDKIIKEAVEGYEAPYDAQAWANVSSRLGSKGGAMKWIAGSAAGVALIVGGVYLFQQDENLVSPEQIVSDHKGDTPSLVADNNTPETADGVSADGNSGILTENQGENPLVEDHTNGNVKPSDSHSNPFQTVNSGNGNGNGTNGSTANNGNNNRNDQTSGNTAGNVQGQNNQHNGNTGNETVVADQPVMNSRFTNETSSACQGENFVFTPEDINQNALYVWDFGDGSYSNSKVASHVFKRAGVYTVTLALKDTKTNKTINKTSTEVTVNALPEINFSWEQSNALIPTVSFINLTENAEGWVWDIKGQRTSSENQFDYTFRKKGVYYVELTAKNEFGCSNSLQKPIEIKNDYNLLAPTAFTPNGDNKNDYFIPEALRIMDTEFIMLVYDKSGTMVYQTNNVNQPWDGTNVNDNSPAADGAYVWTVQFKNASGETEFYEGQVIITR